MWDASHIVRHMSNIDALIRDITEFCRLSGMAETTFGREAVNDGKFVQRVRSGGRCWPETEVKARAYMLANSHKAKVGKASSGTSEANR